MSKSVKEIVNEILLKVTNIEKKIGSNKENESKKRQNKKWVKWIPFAIVCTVLLIAYTYKVNNTILVLEGNPKNVEFSNFEGNIETNIRWISIEAGQITNRDNMTIIIANKTYQLIPGALVIEFGGYMKNGINYILTKNYEMNFATMGNDSFKAEQMIIERGSNTSEAFHALLTKDRDNSKIEMLNFIIPKSEGILTLKNNDVITLSGDVKIMVNGELIDCNKEIQIANDGQRSASFMFKELSNMQILLNETNSMALNGTITSFVGEFDSGEGNMICTTVEEQKNYSIGAHSVFGKAEKLEFQYDFNLKKYEVLIKGNIKSAKLEDIDILGGPLQILYTNLTGIILALISVGVGWTLESVLKE